jgi:hypothetical protein
MFEGDLIQGLKRVMTLFEDESKAMLNAAHVEMRVLFGIYLAFVRPPIDSCQGLEQDRLWPFLLEQWLTGVAAEQMLFGFYASVFLNTVKAAWNEVSKAREFASMLPLHALDGDGAASVKAFYTRNNGSDESPDDNGADDEQ